MKKEWKLLQKEELKLLKFLYMKDYTYLKMQIVWVQKLISIFPNYFWSPSHVARILFKNLTSTDDILYKDILNIYEEDKLENERLEKEKIENERLEKEKIDLVKKSLKQISNIEDNLNDNFNNLNDNFNNLNDNFNNNFNETTTINPTQNFLKSFEGDSRFEYK